MFLIVRGLSESSGTLTESLDLTRSHMDAFVWVRFALCGCISNFNRPSEHIIRSNQKARTHPPQKGKVSTPNHICYSDFMKQKRIRRNRYRSSNKYIFTWHAYTYTYRHSESHHYTTILMPARCLHNASRHDER